MLEVFGIETKRLMCWSHKYRAYKDHGSNKKLVRVNRNLAEELDKDIGQLQWMVSSETEFCLVYDLIEKKYRSGIFTEVENEILEQFWDYHKSQWGPKSNVCYWYEAAHPFRITNNQGLESKNKDIKDNFTYREQLDIGQMFDQAERIICHNSKLSHENLDNWRPKSLLKDSDGFIRRDSHSIQEAGYGYYLNKWQGPASGARS